MQRWYPIIGSKAAQAAQQDAENVRQRRSHLERILNCTPEGTPPVLSSAAALLDGPFEHPARCSFFLCDTCGQLSVHRTTIVFHSVLAD